MPERVSADVLAGKGNKMNRSRPAVWSMSYLFLIIFGAFLVCIGIYFVFFRPVLLPEDLRYMGLTLIQTDIGSPGLHQWLVNIFRVLGGYIFATGVLVINIAATAFRAHHWTAALSVAIAGSSSIGFMTYVNFRIDSEFKWIIFAVALVWVSSLILFGREMRSGR